MDEQLDVEEPHCPQQSPVHNETEPSSAEFESKVNLLLVSNFQSILGKIVKKLLKRTKSEHRQTPYLTLK